MRDARAFDISPETFADAAARDAYLDATSGNLMRLAARLLGTGDRHDALAKEAGIAYGVAGLIRSQAFHRSRDKRFLADADAAAEEARQRMANARALPKPGRALPAFLPAALVPLYLRNSAKDAPLFRKQIAMVGAAMRGHV
jgi:phytoene/squalene synthetase